MKRGSNNAWIVGNVAYVDVSSPKHPRTFTIISAVDVPRVVDGNGRWQPYFNVRANRMYVIRRTGPARTRRSVFLHRHLLGLTPDDARLGDHRNHDGLDNRRENLRAATHVQNCANARHGRGASAFKGVSRHHSGRWRAEIRAYGVTRHLGIFDTEAEAARAYDAAALDAFGEFALTNFQSVLA